MQMKLAHKDESAWAMGDYSYDFGDTLVEGKVKAASFGIRPCSDEYAAFMTAFGRRVRIKQVSPRKVAANSNELAQPESGVAHTPDFLRAMS